MELTCGRNGMMGGLLGGGLFVGFWNVLVCSGFARQKSITFSRSFSHSLSLFAPHQGALYIHVLYIIYTHVECVYKIHFAHIFAEHFATDVHISHSGEFTREVIRGWWIWPISFSPRSFKLYSLVYVRTIHELRTFINPRQSESNFLLEL